MSKVHRCAPWLEDVRQQHLHHTSASHELWLDYKMQELWCQYMLVPTSPIRCNAQSDIISAIDVYERAAIAWCSRYETAG
jgi:hypothetical protein